MLQESYRVTYTGIMMTFAEEVQVTRTDYVKTTFTTILSDVSACFFEILILLAPLIFITRLVDLWDFGLDWGLFRHSS